MFKAFPETSNVLTLSSQHCPPSGMTTHKIAGNFDSVSELHDHEIVLVQDDTPLKNVYNLRRKLIANEDVHIEKTAKTRENDGDSVWHIPFYLFFSLYLLVSISSWLLGRVLRISSRLNQVPFNLALCYPGV